jgi:hypothetical protein
MRDFNTRWSDDSIGALGLEGVRLGPISTWTKSNLALYRCTMIHHGSERLVSTNTAYLWERNSYESDYDADSPKHLPVLINPNMSPSPEGDDNQITRGDNGG